MPREVRYPASPQSYQCALRCHSGGRQPHLLLWTVEESSLWPPCSAQLSKQSPGVLKPQPKVGNSLVLTVYGCRLILTIAIKMLEKYLPFKYTTQLWEREKKKSSHDILEWQVSFQRHPSLIGQLKSMRNLNSICANCGS